MKYRHSTWAVLLAAAVTIPAQAAQQTDELEIEMQEAAMLLEEANRQRAEMQRQRAEQVRVAEEVRREVVEVQREQAVVQREQAQAAEVRLREAELALAEAARQVADLSLAQLPRVERLERIIRTGGGPVLGVTIGTTGETGPVEGVEIIGVSPGGAAADVGLRAGDVITSINGESLMAESGEEANKMLLDFMEGVEIGDELDVGYLRNGRTATVTLEPRSMTTAFAFDFDGNDFTVPVAPVVRQFQNYIWMSHDAGFGDMELISLTDRLGSYFGTSEGLLVVRAPGNDELQLEDGDVILNIDGRTPSSVSHAMRILASYQAGEVVKIEVMRDQRKRTVEIELPDNRQSALPPRPPLSPVAPAPSVSPTPVGVPSPAVAPSPNRT